MPYQLWSQDSFSKGELSPYMYARAQVNQYADGLKKAQNVLNYPTGAAGKRFGTLFEAILSGITASNQIYFNTFQYLDQCIYQIIFSPLNIAIYLEGILVANVTTTLDAQSVHNLTDTTIGALFRVTGQGFKPMDLARSASTGNVISAAGSNQLTLTTPVTAGLVLPVQFTTTGTFPTSNPQIKAGITYYVNYINTTTAVVYSSSYEAKFNINPYTITNNGTGTNTLVPQNTWTFSATVFKNLPVYDFNQNYDTIIFTPSQVSGFNTTITASGAIFTAALVGGAFIGNGGTSRITIFTDSTHIIVATSEPFDSVDGILGSLVLLAEPAWSDARGWPQICSSYQNRALFANTVSLPNGFWASVINDYGDYGDLTADDDDAIAWFPTSDAVNVIRFIVPFRSITVHTNSGIYSSPLSDVTAITPSNFTLQLQDSTPADVLQPQAIDNQIMILSGNDLHSMLWDGINNAYTSNIVSVINEQTIRTPVDETVFADLRRAGSRYVFIVNANGSLAVYQTLIAENVAGMTPQIMEQSYGDASFLQCASSSNGRCWFVCQRQIAVAAMSDVVISNFTPTTLQANGSNLSTTEPTAVIFQTAGTLPTSSPQIELDTYYWGVGIDPNNFMVFLSQADAEAGVDGIIFTNAGTNARVLPWPLSTIFTLEELTQQTHLDCAVQYDGAPAVTLNTGPLFNAQKLKMVGDGFGFDGIGIDNEIAFVAHGAPVFVSNAFVGFPINTVIEPMPLALPLGPNNTLTKPKHIRSVRFMFNNTIGGTINGVPIALNMFDEANIGEPPFPARGIFEMSIMQGWDDFKIPSFTIEHSEPFDIQLIGVFYSVDT